MKNDNVTNIVISSLDASEMTGKEHSHILADIRKLIEFYNTLPVHERDIKMQGVVVSSYIDGNNRPRIKYLLSKTTALDLCMRYSTDVRNRVIIRLDELESLISVNNSDQVIINGLDDCRKNELIINEELLSSCKINTTMGSLCVIKNSATGNVKLGVSIDTETRVNDLQLGNENTLSVVYESAPINNALGLKNTISKMFVDKLIDYEWYDLSVDDMVISIKELISLTESN